MNRRTKEFLKTLPFYSFLKLYRRYQFKRRIKYFHIEGDEMLQLLSQSLNQAGITFWLEFGTLLGYYREHDFIEHDMDIDIGAHFSDATLLRNTLLHSGFKLVREFRCDDGSGLEECYMYKHSTFDVFYFIEEGGNRFCNSFSLREGIARKLNAYLPCVVKKIVVPKFGFNEVDYKGSKVKVPQHTDIYLQSHYGKDFMIPNPNFDYKSEATNIIYYCYEEKPAKAYLKF